LVQVTNLNQRKIQHDKTSYNPEWIVELAKKQIPNQKKVIESLKRCTKIVKFCNCGCGDPYFVKPDEWDFDHNEVLVRDDGVEVILDIMKDNKVGAIEIGEWHKKK